MLRLFTIPNVIAPFPSKTIPSSSTPTHCSLIRAKMSSDSLPPPPDNRIVLGCGTVTVDFLAAVAAYPNPDDKIGSTGFKVQGGGNVGNALTCAARLGLNPRLISKGRSILEELKADGVDPSFLVVSDEGNSPFTYVIVDNQTKTRTCIHTPGYPPMIPDDLSQESLVSALDDARVVYFDGRLPETALVVAQEAARKNIPILIDAERKREGLDNLLELADYAICSAKFPQLIINTLSIQPNFGVNWSFIGLAWTEAPSIPSALVSMLLRLPNLKFVIVTLGKDGCVMLERNVNGDVVSEEIDVDSLLETLRQRKDDSIGIPTCLSSPVAKLTAQGIGAVSGRLFAGTAEKIPPSELVDTTGAGDAFIGAALYAICADMPPEKMLPFAAQVAAANCRALGARTGLPHRTDPCLASFLS
ncbi:uncharacterized protein LOC120010763 isoform X2 [Tripterygium wilfordii]|uniref:uncharacterized protein LOC120010763 isoform X2 n=1 Tax=Tripterygium wilfordii TaxID=458696 RepID=UPI0018F8315A|nr:uncharacterized protein LOC120010763 isoform X2 [Tripterygium wilfordii]